MCTFTKDVFTPVAAEKHKQLINLRTLKTTLLFLPHQRCATQLEPEMN